jgi:uncharacterized protein YecT (DUF1311 family)
MRRLISPTALLLAASCAAAPGFAETAVRPSQSVCDSDKIGGRELADCLRKGVEEADSKLRGALDAALKSIDARAGLLSSQKSRWRRALGEAQEQWATWRESECQDVAPFEAGMASKGADPRLSCIIDADAERTASLKARYP